MARVSWYSCVGREYERLGFSTSRDWPKSLFEKFSINLSGMPVIVSVGHFFFTLPSLPNIVSRLSGTLLPKAKCCRGGSVSLFPTSKQLADRTKFIVTNHGPSDQLAARLNKGLGMSYGEIKSITPILS